MDGHAVAAFHTKLDQEIGFDAIAKVFIAFETKGIAAVQSARNTFFGVSRTGSNCYLVGLIRLIEGSVDGGICKRGA